MDLPFLLFFQFLIFRNGHFLGVAFDNVQYGPGLAYFPAASLSYGESCHMNFGSAPFKYPFDKQRKTKQNKTNKQKKARKREKKVKTSFRESVLQFRKIMVGPLDWLKFLWNRLRIMLPFRYVTLRVRVFYLYLHNSSGIQWGFPDSLLWPVSLPSASPRDERFLARGKVSRPWATRAGGGLKGVWHWLFLPEPPQTSSRLVPNFPAGREICVM